MWGHIPPPTLPWAVLTIHCLSYKKDYVALYPYPNFTLSIASHPLLIITNDYVGLCPSPNATSSSAYYPLLIIPKDYVGPYPSPNSASSSDYHRLLIITKDYVGPYPSPNSTQSSAFITEMWNYHLQQLTHTSKIGHLRHVLFHPTSHDVQKHCVKYPLCIIPTAPLYHCVEMVCTKTR